MGRRSPVLEAKGSMGVQAFMPPLKVWKNFLSNFRSFPRPSPTQTTIMQRHAIDQRIRVSHETTQSTLQPRCMNQRSEQQLTPTLPISRTYKTRSETKRY